MLLDLARFKCTHFLMQGRIRLPDGAAFFERVIGQRVTPKRPYSCEESYNVSGGFHYLRALVDRKLLQTYEISLHLDCDPDEEGEVSNDRAVSHLIQELSISDIRAVFDYDIVFVFSRQASRAIFPWKLPVLPGAVLDEVRGFRGIKNEGRRVLYKLSIESPELDELYINVEFRREDVLGYDSLEQRLLEATKIAQNIVSDDEWRT